MGGDAHGHGGFDTRAVWSPSGGWYADPRYWRRNTAVAFGVLAVVGFGIASVSAKLEVRYGLPAARRCMPQQGLGLRWSGPTAARALRPGASWRWGQATQKAGRQAQRRFRRARRGVCLHATLCLVQTPADAEPIRAPRPQQRPLAPIRQIPSQRWCDNFPKEEEKAKK
jgi:hypothetical protein